MVTTLVAAARLKRRLDHSAPGVLSSGAASMMEAKKSAGVRSPQSGRTTSHESATRPSSGEGEAIRALLLERMASSAVRTSAVRSHAVCAKVASSIASIATRPPTITVELPSPIELGAPLRADGGRCFLAMPIKKESITIRSLVYILYEIEI